MGVPPRSQWLKRPGYGLSLPRIALGGKRLSDRLLEVRIIEFIDDTLAMRRAREITHPEEPGTERR